MPAISVHLLCMSTTWRKEKIITKRNFVKILQALHTGLMEFLHSEKVIRSRLSICTATHCITVFLNHMIWHQKCTTQLIALKDRLDLIAPAFSGDFVSVIPTTLRLPVKIL